MVASEQAVESCDGRWNSSRQVDGGVYRNYAAYLDALKWHYHLTFFRLGRHGPDPEVGIFDRVEQLDVVNGVLNIDLLRQNDFMVVYYPDIGSWAPAWSRSTPSNHARK